MVWKHITHWRTFHAALSFRKRRKLCPKIFVASPLRVCKHSLVGWAQEILRIYQTKNLCLCFISLLINLRHRGTGLWRFYRRLKQSTSLNRHRMFTNTRLELTLRIPFTLSPIPLPLWITIFGVSICSCEPVQNWLLLFWDLICY